MSYPLLSGIAVLVNPKAGKGRSRRVLQQLIPLMQGMNYEVFEVGWPIDLNKYSDVFLIGGDGTLNYFINHYPDLSIPITLFKGGSGNDFAWKLYGNRSVQQHFESAISGDPKAVDGGICNGRYFLNGVGIGFDGAIVESMGVKRFLSAGYISYLYTVLKHLVFYKEFFATINERTFKTFMLTVANGSRYGGGFMVAPQAIVNDGKLDFLTIFPIASIKRIFYLPKISSGNHLQLPFVKSELIKDIVIKTDKKVPAHCDGELLIDDRFEIHILPGRYLFRY